MLYIEAKNTERMVVYLDNSNISLYAFRKYGDMVLRAAYACCGCYAEAEDIAQDVFLHLHATPVEFEDDEHIKAWLLRVTINRCKNYRRSFRISRTQPIDEESSGMYSMDTTDIEVRELIFSLPPKYSAVIYLYYYEGYQIKEIGEILGKNPNTVNSLLQRGREKLRMELSEENKPTKRGSVRRT